MPAGEAATTSTGRIFERCSGMSGSTASKGRPPGRPNPREGARVVRVEFARREDESSAYDLGDGVHSATAVVEVACGFSARLDFEGLTTAVSSCSSSLLLLRRRRRCSRTSSSTTLAPADSNSKLLRATTEG